jgi:two-component system NarL family sensor kinase
MSAVTLIITIGTLIFLLTAGIVTFFFYSYQQRFNLQLKEKEELKSAFQNEILKAQLEMQEQTFLTISQEIHDNIGQILSLIRLNISTIQPHNYEATEHKISSSKELLDKAIQDLRDLSKRLNTEFVRRQSLADSLRFQLNLIQRTELYYTTLAVKGEERPINPDEKVIIFRIVQEALNNIIKHAEAKHIAVDLSYLPGKIVLCIKDDGRGFDDAAVSQPDGLRKGIGTNNMYYRAKLIGAEFSLNSKPGNGCQAQLILPTA